MNREEMIVDAPLALIRHGVMTSEFQAGRWKVPAPKVTRLPSYRPPRVSDDVLEEYQFELLERAGKYMDDGVDQDKADRLAQDDLGCVEFWELVRDRQVDGRVHAPVVRYRDDGCCSRCESIGHGVTRCPFPDSIDVRALAERRHRRRSKVVAA